MSQFNEFKRRFVSEHNKIKTKKNENDDSNIYNAKNDSGLNDRAELEKDEKIPGYNDELKFQNQIQESKIDISLDKLEQSCMQPRDLIVFSDIDYPIAPKDSGVICKNLRDFQNEFFDILKKIKIERVLIYGVGAKDFFFLFENLFAFLFKNIVELNFEDLSEIVDFETEKSVNEESNAHEQNVNFENTSTEANEEEKEDRNIFGKIYLETIKNGKDI